ncbi:MAG TPA: VOC family protein [Polyangia bacterium]|nr:VOC family protein [Polyangia bacterium]
MADRPAPGRLWHLALQVADVARMERFYMEILGFVIEWKPDDDNVYLTSGRDNLALHRRGGEERPGPDSRLAHLGLVVERADDVDGWADWLRAQGVPIDSEPRTHRDGARSLYFRDPEGNRIQIIHHPPISPYVG